MIVQGAGYGATRVTIPNTYIFLPLLLQVLLTVAVYLALSVAKSRAVEQGLVDPQRRALHEDAWPESVQKINNNIRNQFEVPVLFYVLVITLYLLDAAGVLAQALAWLFVGSRMLHAYIHTGENYVPARRAVFMFGCVVVLAMLIVAIPAVLA
jgi:hypothetical protein